METLIKDYGLPGIIIGGLAWFVLFLMKSHKAERKEFADRLDKHMDKMDKREAETNETIKENTGILQGLKTLLENRK